MAGPRVPIGLPLNQRRRKGARRGRGQAMVEFLLVLPALLILVMGAVEFARLLAVYTVVNASSREAARYGAGLGDTGIGTKNRYQDCTGIVAAANRVARSFIALNTITIQYDQGPGSALIAPVGCPPPAAQVGLGTRIIVRVTATYRPIVPLVPIGTLTITSETKRTLITDVIVGTHDPTKILAANGKPIPHAT